MAVSRRSLFAVFAALVASPTIVKAVSFLPVPIQKKFDYLILNDFNKIARSSILLFENSNAFIKIINGQYHNQFAESNVKIGERLRIRLPKDYNINGG